jgi:hypothetical protein
MWIIFKTGLEVLAAAGITVAAGALILVFFVEREFKRLEKWPEC